MKYFNNIIAYLIFLFSDKFFGREKIEGRKGKILFVNLGLLGDVVISTVIFANVSLLSDYSEIFFLTDVKFRELFVNYNGKINLLFVDKKKYRTNLFYRIKFITNLRKYEFVKVHNLSFTRISIDDEISILASERGNVFAFENNRNLKRYFAKKFDEKYSEIISRKDKSDFENISSVIEKIAGKKAIHKTTLFPRKSVKRIIPNKYFVVAPYASIKIKEWGKRKYSALIKKLIDYYGYSVVILHSKGTDDFKTLGEKVINLTGKTSLADVVDIICQAEFFIGNDTGLLHIAKALGKNVFGIIGGGVLGRIYPYNSADNSFYFYRKTNCLNCDWICKLDEPICLTHVNYNEVFEKIISIIK